MVFDALALNLRALDAIENTDIKALGSVIADGLAGKRHVLLQVTAFVRVGAGQEVFLAGADSGQRQKQQKQNAVRRGWCGRHALAKIGNAIRTIDTWYEGAAELGPIAVEPYGSVTTQGKAYRQPKQKMDFYTLLDNWLLKDQVPPVEQQHFVMAVLMRGGVFGDAS